MSLKAILLKRQEQYYKDRMGMFTQQWRIIQADHNVNTQKHLQKNNPEFIDWEITCLFYAAVQLVNEYLRHRGLKIPMTHKERNPLVKKLLAEIYPDFWKLYSISLQTRYTSSFNTFNENNRNAVKTWFSNINTKVRQAITP